MDTLFEIETNIKKLQKQKKQLIETTIKSMQKPISEWATILSLPVFKNACLQWFAENFNRQQGSDYFSWNKTAKIQSDFEEFVKEELKSKFSYYFNSTKHYERFFYLKKVRSSSRDRAINEIETWEIAGTKKAPQLIYEYSGTTFNGFNNQNDSTQQRLEIDLTKLEVIRYEDSRSRYNGRSTGAHKLSTDFITKLI